MARTAVMNMPRRINPRLTFNAASCYFSSSSRPISSPFTNVTPPKCTVNEMIWSRVKKWPDAIALAMTGESVTYRELFGKSKQLAASLRFNVGLKPADTVTIVLPNSPAFAVSFMGILEAGLRVTFINPSFTEMEIVQLLRDSESKLVITTVAHETNILNAINHIVDRRIQLICTKDINTDSPPTHSRTIKFEELLQKNNARASQIEGNLRREILDLNDFAALLYSSGTTGLPKGTCQSHSAMTHSLAQVMHPDIITVPETTKDFQACVPVLIPMFHSYGLLSVTLKTLYAGGMLLTIPNFRPERFLAILEGNQNIYLHCVPPLINFLINHPGVKKAHLQNLKLTVVGGSTFSQLDCEMLLTKREHDILNGFKSVYGTTETSVIAQSLSDPVSHFCLRLAPNVTAKIVSDSGQDLATGQQGEICIKGPQVMSGYYKNPVATAATIDSKGWLHTGDIGVFDENEHLQVVGRIKELIKVKGFQVSPVELEEVIKNHPDVDDVAVVGEKCHKAGERPVAFIVPKGQQRLKEETVVSYMSTRVAPYKQLSRVIFINRIPRNPTGKILRRELKDML